MPYYTIILSTNKCMVLGVEPNGLIERVLDALGCAFIRINKMKGIKIGSDASAQCTVI